jgi:hypothetical protein
VDDRRIGEEAPCDQTLGVGGVIRRLVEQVVVPDQFSEIDAILGDRSRVRRAREGLPSSNARPSRPTVTAPGATTATNGSREALLEG